MSDLEENLLSQIRAAKLPEPEREYPFAKDIGRRWRFDFAWPTLKIASEVEGGTYSGGRHTRGSGFEKDCEKYNTAIEMGWGVVRFTGKMINSGDALATLTRLLEGVDGGRTPGVGGISRNPRDGQMAGQGSVSGNPD